MCVFVFAGSIPDDYGDTRLSSLSQTPPDFSFFLLGGDQQPVHTWVHVCGVMCVRGKKKKKTGRDSLTRKSHSIAAVRCRSSWIVVVNSSALPAVECCNPSTSCDGYCCSIAIFASGDGRQKVCVCVWCALRVCVHNTHVHHKPRPSHLNCDTASQPIATDSTVLCQWKCILFRDVAKKMFVPETNETNIVHFALEGRASWMQLAMLDGANRLHVHVRDGVGWLAILALPPPPDTTQWHTYTQNDVLVFRGDETLLRRSHIIDFEFEIQYCNGSAMVPTVVFFSCGRFVLIPRSWRASRYAITPHLFTAVDVFLDL